MKTSSRAAFVAAAITAAVFFPLLANAFLNYDDPLFLAVAARGLTSDLLTKSQVCNYAPLFSAVMALLYKLRGAEPFVFHLASVIAHAANAALVFAVARELLAKTPSKDDEAAALVAALCFALHPLRVQSVAWMSDLDGVLSGTFFLGALLLWLRGRKAASWASFVGALLCKSTVVPFPFVLVGLDVWPLRRDPRRHWKEKIPFFAASAIFLVSAFYAQQDCHAIPGDGPTGSFRLQQLCSTPFFYFSKLLWPVRLSFYERGWDIVGPQILIGVAAAAVFAAIAYRWRPLRVPLAAAFAWQILVLGPVSGLLLLGHEVAADRYFYLPGVSWALLAGAGFRALARVRPRVAVAAAALVLASYAGLTRAYCAVWKDSSTLWRYTLKVDPISAHTRPNLAGALSEEGRYGEAFLYLEEQVRLYPADAVSQKRVAEMSAQLKLTASDRARLHAELAREFMGRDEYVKAAWHFGKAVQYEPKSRVYKAQLDAARRSAP
ncbi:MAG: glycosyltransferase family 39 protein [Elusimicrobia bacterium]|nr:glycosyltransferase family 39 protein [Elusimicrobiota bacterium]